MPVAARVYCSIPAGVLACLVLAGCAGRGYPTRAPSPVKAGYNTRDLIDPLAQPDADRLGDTAALAQAADRYRRAFKPDKMPPKRSVLCLSGGGAYGAYSAGVLYGWTCRGDRPEFDVVTGISTGALIAPFAFLGPRYDRQMQEFYTTLESRDVFRLRVVRGLFTEALADNAPLARKIDETLTPEFVCELAAEHRKGRRLYVGTTELDARRFVFWDIGEIAGRGTPQDRELIKHILLGSSAIPGFFPPARIPVEVDGRRYVERHVDGGVSQALFFRPPYVPPDRAADSSVDSLYGTDVYALVAGKLYADPEVHRPRALAIAAGSASAVLYAQTRGDLTRLWTVCQLTGMNYHMTAIPAEFPAPRSGTEFRAAEMTLMFNEGARRIQAGTAWRTTPPGAEPGESHLKRAGTNLMYQPPDAVPAFGPEGAPIPPGSVVK
ncbi:MAG: patatin [Gemmataceae bacterium]|nr:patatin [Gemmataceae bacterium]